MLKERGIYLILCFACLVYIVFRALYVPLVHDEVATYVHYIHQGEFIPGLALLDANNHILNSILSIVFDRIFGTSPFSMRLANVLSFIVFVVYVYRLSFQINDRILRWCLALGLLGSHYLIEFFSLSRGYGISMAAMLGLIWHIRQYLSEMNIKDGLMTLLWFCTCLGANFSLLFVVMISTGLLILHKLIHKKGSWALILMSFGLIACASKVTFMLKEAGALYYGQGPSFWVVTMQSLSRHLGGNDGLLPYLFAFAAIGCALVYFLRPLSLGKLIDARWIYHILLLGSLCGIFIAHVLFETNYPEDRVGLYLFPLLLGAVVTSLDYLKTRWPHTRFFALALLYFPIHFMLNANIDHCDFWFRERIPEGFYSLLEDENIERNATVTLSGYQTTALSYFMGAQLSGQKVPPMISYDFPSHVSDYLILRGEHGVTYDMQDYALLATDSLSGNTLWKRKKAKQKVEIKNISQSGHQIDGDEYYNLVKIELSGEHDYAVRFEISYRTEDYPSDINLVLSSQKEEAKDLHYIPHYLGWRQDERALSDAGSMYILGSGSGIDEVTFYLWNIDQTSIHDLSYQVQIYRLE